MSLQSKLSPAEQKMFQRLGWDYLFDTDTNILLFYNGLLYSVLLTIKIILPYQLYVELWYICLKVNIVVLMSLNS